MQRTATSAQRELRYPLNALYDVMVEHANKRPHARGKIAHCCLMDERRTMKLMEIVSACTIPETNGIDLGAGFGPLAFAFLNAGGRQVYMIEQDAELCLILERIAERLGMQRQVKVIKLNLRRASILVPEQVDMVMAELVISGLITEPLISAIRKTRAITSADAQYIPESVSSSIRLLDSYRKPVTEKVEYDFIDLRTNRRNMVNTDLEMRISCGTMATTVCYTEIESSLGYPNGETTGRFDTLCVPIRRSIANIGNLLTLQDGTPVDVHVSYKYGASALKSIAIVTPKQRGF